jgi:hypothetical protein
VTPIDGPGVGVHPAGNGATEGGLKSPPDAPASAPVEVGSDLDRADVARCVEEALGIDLEPWQQDFLTKAFMADDLSKLWRVPQPDRAVARTLDVAEATADKARAVGLARETAS